MALRAWDAAEARRVLLLRGAVALLALDAAIYLSYEFWRLLVQGRPMGGVDLHSRLTETHAWFDGARVYGRLLAAVYPPATYALLWPFVGWLGFGAARWLWALVTVAGLAGLAVLFVRASRARPPLEVAFVVLVLLAVYPTGQTIGNGQLLTLVLPLVLAGVLLALRDRPSWASDAVAAVCFVVSLAKPTGVVPFLLVPLLARRRIRPLALTAVACAGLTVLAASFQKPSLPTLVHQWEKASSDLAAYHGTIFYANVHAWLGALGLKSLILPASLLVLVAFAWWTWTHRRLDPWVLIAVAALVARFWTYHQSYDDMLVLLPLVALLRIAVAPRRDGARTLAAALLFVLTLAVLLVPGGLFLFPHPLRTPFTTLETVIWLSTLVFFVRHAREERAVAVARPVEPAPPSQPQLSPAPR